MEDTKSQRGAKRLTEDDENVQLWFITDEDGTPVSGEWGAKARDKARSLWRTVHASRVMPATWGEADSMLREYFITEMEKSFWESSLQR